MVELKTLVASAGRGDLEAYGEIVRRFQDMAVGYAFSVLGDFHLAEDAAQEAFLQAYLDLEKLDEGAAFPGWFRRIVFKHCDRIRRQRHHYTVPLEEDCVQSPGKDPAAGLEERELCDRLGIGIHHLPMPERAVITLFYISQFTQKEIAAFLEVPESTVNNRLHAARKRLKKELMQMAQDHLQEQRPSQDEAFAGRVQEHLTALKVLHEKLTPLLTALFSQALGKEIKVVVASVNHTICVEVVQRFTSPSCTYFFVPGPGQKPILFEVGLELAFALVGRQFAAGDALRLLDLAQVLRDEIPQINRLARQMLTDLVGIWQPVLDMELLQPQVETNPLYLIANPKGKILDPEEPVFHVLLEATWEDHTSQLNLCYPAASLAAAIARLEQH